MRPYYVAALSATGNAASLADVCTVENVKAALPADGTLLGIQMVPSSVAANALYNVTGGMTNTAYTYCNVTFSYTHTGKGDTVVVKYAFPQPSDFENRFYVAGGGGYSLTTDATGGVQYGAASGATDAGVRNSGSRFLVLATSRAQDFPFRDKRVL